AEIADADRLAAAIETQPGVTAAVPVVGANLYVRRGGRRFPSSGLGGPSGTPGAYPLVAGADLPARPGPPSGGTAPVVPIVINQNMARLDGVRIGDRVVLSAAPGTILQTFAAAQACRVAGIADFYFDLPAQRTVALAGPVLRRLLDRPPGGASLLLVRMTDPSRGVAPAAAALPGAFLLGIAIARHLDRILLSAPGVPENLHFFTFTAAAAVRTVGILLATGALGGAYPAAVTARLEVAPTLHREVVS